MLDAIETLRHDWLSEFTFIPVLSEEPEGSAWQGRRGYVAEALGDVLRAMTAEAIEKDTILHVRAAAMIDRAIELLTGAGVDSGQIHYDKFTDARRPVDA